MIFKYQVGVITLAQFVSLSLLGIANGLNSIISTCKANEGDCASNTLVSLIFFLLTAGWFAFIWVLGYTAQERRSKRLAQVLICAETLIALVALFNAKHHTDLLGLGTSLIDLFLATWVIILAFRLMRADGGRVVVKHRGRRRAKSR